MLHPEIQKIVAIARKYFSSKTTICILSNGLLLNNMSDDFYKTLADNEINIYYSKYVQYKNYPDLTPAYEKAKKYGVYIESFGDIKTFDRTASNLKGVYYKVKSYNDCIEKHNFLFDNGKLSTCASVCGNIKIFNNYFKDYALPVNENDYLYIYKISSVVEIKEFFARPK